MVRVILRPTPTAGTNYKYSALVEQDNEHQKQGSPQDVLLNVQAVAFNHW